MDEGKIKQTILVVEDNPLSMKLVADLLQLNGFDVLKAPDGESALGTLKTFIPDLVLMDLDLPGINGIEAFRKIREDSRLNSVKVAALTASAMKQEIAKAEQVGFDAYMTKPIDTKTFIKNVKELLSEKGVGKQSAVTRERKRILVVDDDEKVRTLLKVKVEETENYECMVASSGEEGINYVMAHKPDLVLLDIMMPGMDGLATLKRIKEIDKEIPVCMVTAVWSDEEGKRCLDAGAYDYITKPVDFEYLKTALFVKLLE